MKCKYVNCEKKARYKIIYKSKKEFIRDTGLRFCEEHTLKNRRLDWRTYEKVRI